MENEVLKSPSEFDVSSAIKKWRSQGFSKEMIELAGKKCFRSKAKYNLIQQMKEADLSKSQMEQIQVAIESGLTDTEVSDIINSGFDVEEMAQAIQILLADKMYQ